jgi:xanthine dioxygenase
MLWISVAQYLLTKSFDPQSESYGHGNNKTGNEPKSILHPDLKTIPEQPQVQLIGNGPHTDPYITRGLETSPSGEIVPVKLKHPSHKSFHKTVVSDEDEEKNRHTRFYRWHIDAA